MQLSLLCEPQCWVKGPACQQTLHLTYAAGEAHAAARALLHGLYRVELLPGSCQLLVAEESQLLWSRLQSVLLMLI
jgi:hypothetical protein